MDIIESHKEISYSLMEVYMSAQNNRMSEVMKVLTVISSIFIPLTFIVGVYGMNFSYKTENGEILRYNMPELYHPYGYRAVLMFMGLIAVIQIIYFKRKRWL
jgi:magnesium transporter